MGDTPKEGLGGPALYTGIGVVIAWFAMIVWLIFHINDAEVQWSRLVFLLSSVEAVAFGAAGALFGTQVQRKRVEEAQHRAAKAEVEAASNREAATKGKVLAGAVKAEANAAGHGFKRVSNDESAPEMTTSLALANELLP